MGVMSSEEINRKDSDGRWKDLNGKIKNEEYFSMEKKMGLKEYDNKGK